MSYKKNRCNEPGESGIIGVSESNNQDDDLKLTPHQFQIALIEMPRLSRKMRDAMRRVVVDGESQKAVADSASDVNQQHLSKNLAVFREIFLEKLGANDCCVREVIIPKSLESAVDDLEYHATRHLLERQRIGKRRTKTKKGTGADTDNNG